MNIHERSITASSFNAILSFDGNHNSKQIKELISTRLLQDLIKIMLIDALPQGGLPRFHPFKRQGIESAGEHPGIRGNETQY